jgi:hypothetical protein
MTTSLASAISDLDGRFWTWRSQQAPRTRDDLPRLDRPAGWRPAWGRQDVHEHLRMLTSFDAEQKALLARATGTPAAGPAERADEVDLRLIGSAIERARFEIDGAVSWQRDPWFYLDQTIGAVYDLLLPPLPFDEHRCEELLVRLGSFGPTLAAGRENGAGNLALELAEAANERAGSAGAALVAALAALSAHVTTAWAGRLGRAGRAAADELDTYAEWLAAEMGNARPLRGVGEHIFARYLYEVALLPLTPAEILAAGRQEWDRAVAFELFEQHRVPEAAWPALPTSASAQVEAERAAEVAVRRFYEAHDLLSQPSSLRHYLNQPLPGYLEPLHWLGVSDDLTGPDRLDQDGVSYVPVPSLDLPYFYRANAADPRAGIVHEGAHYQQLALAWAHPRPARRHFYDSCPNEGIAFYNEEMLTQAGLFDDAPVTRRVIYNFMRLRALRVEVDVRSAIGELSIDEAGSLLELRVPMDGGTARAEAAFFAAVPAQGLSYAVGKLQLLRLLADARTSAGPGAGPAEGLFSLRKFHDWLWLNGNVPFSLLRYELLGDRSDLDRVDRLRPSGNRTTE